MPIKHGTNRGYTFYKCRCEECREAHRLAAAVDRERNSARINATKRRYYTENPEPILERNRQWRADNPEKVKEIDRQKYLRNRERHLEQSKVYYQLNKQAYIERSRRWKQKNPEATKESAKRTRSRYQDEYNEASRKRMAASYAADPDKYRQKNREWAKTPAGRLYFRAKREQRRGAPYTKAALEWIASLVDPLCTYCGEPATDIDHIIPVSKGGTGDRDNLTPACRSCNARKHAMSLEKFLARIEKEKA